MEKEKESVVPLCVNCFHCKIKEGKISCKEGNFKNLSYREACLLTPFDYECWKGIF